MRFRELPLGCEAVARNSQLASELPDERTFLRQPRFTGFY